MHPKFHYFIKRAREMGYEKVWGLIAVRNDAMLGLARRLGFSIVRDPDDRRLMRAEIDPNRPDQGD